MSNAEIPGSAMPECSRHDVFAACVESDRRKLLFALASGGPQTGADAMNFGKLRVRDNHQRLDSALKYLVGMVKSGVIVRLPNPRDGRRPLYALPPSVTVSKSAEGVEIDYQFCVIRLSADR